MNTVIITDGLLRKSLSVTRSLGKKGIKTIVGEKSWFSPSGFSKYCFKRVKYPNPVENREDFLHWLCEMLKKENQPIFMPMDDVVMDIVMEFQEIVEPLCTFLLPSKCSYAIASDKYKTMKLAKEQMIEAPFSYLANTEEELKRSVENATYPVLIKPRKSSGSRGIRKVNNKEEWTEKYNDIKKEISNLLIQECIPTGERFDVCLIYDINHEVKASFVQKEIRHFPIEMGPSTVQESVLFEELLNKSIKLLKPLNWRGMVEIEFMVDPRNNHPMLMEINPRFWNSLDLSVQCGMDFPYILYQLCSGEEVEVQNKYEIGRRCRSFFPGDMLHFIFNPKRFSMNPSLFSGKKHRVYDDTLSINDPIPSFIILLACIRFAFSKDAWKDFFKR